MKTMLMKPVVGLAKMTSARHDALWDLVEWLAMPIFILYPQLTILKWYRYGS